MNSSARQIGAVLGIAILVVLVGTPTPTATESSLRQGWAFSALCFVAVAVIALFLGHVRSSTRTDDGDDVVLPPAVRLPTARETPSGPGALAGASLFSRLPGQLRARLEESAAPVSLAAGDWLFREGDEADDVFVLTAGRLEVVVGTATARELGAGAVVGELALLAGGTRSASIRARRDSHLLRVSHAAFDEIVGSDPAALRALTEVLASQVRDTAPAVAPSAPSPGVVAVVGLGPGAPAAAVADALATRMRRSLSVALPGQVTPDGLERAERDHDHVVLVADPVDDTWWRTCVRQADLLVVVAASDADPAQVPSLGRGGVDVVLVGPRPSPERIRAWAERLSAWRVTLCGTADIASATRPVADRISGRSVGLVLAGGGARAFAHIGVLQELTEAGVVVDRIAGASQGAIVAALHARGYDPAMIHDLCHDEFVRRRPFSDYTLPTTSLAKGRRAERGLRRHLHDIHIEELPRVFRCSSTDLVTRSVHAHRTGDLVDAVVASFALPALFPPRRSGEQLLVDGGVLDNLPVGLLTERSEGPLVAVNIGMGGEPRPRPEGPGAATAPRPVRTPALGETLMRSLFIGSAGGVDAAAAAGAVVVTPSSMGVGLLEFHQLDRMVESGRAAGRAVLEQYGSALT